jgi:hypothetical protein
MALDATDIRVAGNTHIYLGAVGAVFPDWDDEPDTDDWTDVGYVTPDGVTFNFGREINEIYAMQSAEPVRVVNTRLPKTLGFNLMQQGRTQFAVAMGGGTWAAEVGATGVFRYEPPVVGANDERSALVEMIDGENTYRWHFKRVINREAIEFKYVREDAATFPVTLAVLPPADNTASFYLLSDDPAIAA